MPYLFLVIAITTEVIGSAFLKSAAGFTKLWPSIGAIASFVICFYFLSRTILYIPLNVTYATWAGLGLVLTTVISIIIFKESVNLISVLAIALIIIGVLLLNIFGNSH